MVDTKDLLKYEKLHRIERKEGKEEGECRRVTACQEMVNHCQS